MILAVLSVLLTTPPPISSQVVPFDRMPQILAAAYDADIRQYQNAKGTEVAEIDFDGDGFAEKLVFNGQSGSGGEGWTIFRKEQDNWRQIGEVFGIVSAIEFKKHNGLLVCMPCGWDHADYEYYELKSGKLKKRLEIAVDYSKPIREKPKRIEIRIFDEK